MSGRRWTRCVRIGVPVVVGLALSACGAEPAPSGGPAPFGAVEVPLIGEPVGTATKHELDVAAALPVPADDRPASAVDVAAPAVAAPEVAVPAVAPGPAPQDLDQPAIWPASDVVFATPEEAAADFVSNVLISDGDPALGEFQQGDARSGEIAVLFTGETGELDPPMQRGTLLLRRIGPTDGWYVIAATSDGATIDTPSALGDVTAGRLTVAGAGRGFESTLVVSAFPPGDNTALFDRQIGAGGVYADLEPYSVELDLSGAPPGDVVVILVHGGTGLGSDPSTFAAIPIVIAAAPSPTIPPTK
jgi:hypothetical protein